MASTISLNRVMAFIEVLEDAIVIEVVSLVRNDFLSRSY